ncbi:uncharacterized protein LOC123430853 [Hordeum vulgare subsp. vulgare]|uniref:uncharacterized protein LOC123430853 n=1 Tax=Hordeum vulgare subsp. vulgare TaxID=112509 RepID=UPI001D1A3A6F|nr:uncharacterized protein LOC123430853 [Hordeum vulgare subsp. vulgare]
MAGCVDDCRARGAALVDVEEEEAGGVGGDDGRVVVGGGAARDVGPARPVAVARAAPPARPVAVARAARRALALARGWPRTMPAVRSARSPCGRRSRRAPREAVVPPARAVPGTTSTPVSRCCSPRFSSPAEDGRLRHRVVAQQHGRARRRGREAAFELSVLCDEMHVTCSM